MYGSWGGLVMTSKNSIINDLVCAIEREKPTREQLFYSIELALDNWFEFKRDKKSNNEPSDAEMLNFLDSLNKDQNARHQSNYGWQVDCNHNRISLNDMGSAGLDVRAAISEAIFKQDLRRNAS